MTRMTRRRKRSLSMMSYRNPVLVAFFLVVVVEVIWGWNKSKKKRCPSLKQQTQRNWRAPPQLQLQPPRPPPGGCRDPAKMRTTSSWARSKPRLSCFRNRWYYLLSILITNPTNVVHARVFRLLFSRASAALTVSRNHTIAREKSSKLDSKSLQNRGLRSTKPV